jgi:hypothetical protein
MGEGAAYGGGLGLRGNVEVKVSRQIPLTSEPDPLKVDQKFEKIMLNVAPLSILTYIDFFVAIHWYTAFESFVNAGHI